MLIAFFIRFTGELIIITLLVPRHAYKSHVLYCTGHGCWATTSGASYPPGCTSREPNAIIMILYAADTSLITSYGHHEGLRPCFVYEWSWLFSANNEKTLPHAIKTRTSYNFWSNWKCKWSSTNYDIMKWRSIIWCFMLRWFGLTVRKNYSISINSRSILTHINIHPTRTGKVTELCSP